MSLFENLKSVNSANWKLYSELIESINSFVVVNVERGMDINEKNGLLDVNNDSTEP